MDTPLLVTSWQKSVIVEVILEEIIEVIIKRKNKKLLQRLWKLQGSLIFPSLLQRRYKVMLVTLGYLILKPCINVSQI